LRQLTVDVRPWVNEYLFGFYMLNVHIPQVKLYSIPPGKEAEMAKRITTTKESKTGRNQSFRDNHQGKEMSRSQFVKEIEGGNYNNYHVRKVNGVKTPVSNPDASKNNNLD
jgi:hypothetical protein